MDRDRASISWALAALAAPALWTAAVAGTGSNLPYPAEWKRYGLQGFTVRSLAAAPDLLCAGTQGSGVYCRDLAAKSPSAGWVSNGLPGVTVTWIWIDPATPLVRYAAAGAPGNTPSLFRTLDGGQSWTAVDDFPNPGGGPPPRAYAVAGIAGSRTVFAAGTAIWISHDGGETWEVSSDVGGLDCLEASPADPEAVWTGGETLIFSGFTLRTLDGGETWAEVWDSSRIGDNQTSDVAAHPTRDGPVLTGHEGFVLRTEDDGAMFDEVLAAPSRFFLDWDGGNADRAYAAGSPNGGTAHAFVSQDLGRTWLDVTGTTLAPRTVFRVEGDDTRTGVVYAATDDGVFRYYGGGAPICLHGSGGIDDLRLARGACPPPAGEGSLVGDVIAADPARFLEGDATLFLGEVECIASDADLTLVTLDTPDPAAGRYLAILARPQDEGDYGFTSQGLRRAPLSGDCP
jgi:photosystem II stability/assembly factor-like uncharacterized protein